MDLLHDVRRTLTAEGILICFNGPFSHSIIEELGKAVKRYLESEEVRKSALLDVFSVYIEATQNVANYANRRDRPEEERQRLNSGIVVIGRQGEHYVIHCGNVVLPADGRALKARIDHLNTLDKAGLKAMYKAQVHGTPDPGGLGAGLGLIDMARKASEPLAYSLIPEEGGLDFFYLKVTL